MLSSPIRRLANGDRSSGENDGTGCESWRGSEDTNSPKVDDGDSVGSDLGALLAGLGADDCPMMTGNSGFAVEAASWGGLSNKDENGESGGALR